MYAVGYLVFVLEFLDHLAGCCIPELKCMVIRSCYQDNIVV